MVITCAGGSPHYLSGCELLKHYADTGTGTISTAAVMRAANDAGSGIITIEEQNYVLSCWNVGGDINTMCPGCYITCTGGSATYGTGCELLKHYAGSDGIISVSEANQAISDRNAGHLTNYEVDYIVNECFTPYGGDINSTCPGCYVPPPPILTTITVSPTPINIPSNGSQLFTASPIDQYGNPISATITWTISDPAAGSINSSTGLFSASSVGTDTIITVTATSESISGTATATVLRVPPILTTITVSPTPKNIPSNGSQLFTASPIDQYGNPISAIITWNNSNPVAGSINSSTGLFSASSVSTDTSTTVTANSGSTNGSATVTVLRALPTLTTIVITPTTASIQIGATQQLDATCIDQYSASFVCPTLIWSSTSPSVAIVNSSGLVTGIIVGSAGITASNGTITSDVSLIIVEAAPAEAGGIGMIALAGLGIVALMSMKKS